MSALLSSPPDSAARHRRWIAPGRGGTQTAAMLSGNITLSIVPMSPDNRRPTLSQRRSQSFVRRTNTGAVTTSDSARFSNPHRRNCPKTRP